MIRAITTALIALMASTGPEIVEVSDVGPVDLSTFACTDTPRSTVVQRVCYDASRSYLLIASRGVYLDHCGVPEPMVRALLGARSMGQFYRATFEAGGEAASFRCLHRRS